MQGFYVPRVSGWDCHGLPVEISVEKELQFEDKARIEGYGIERFNNVCRSSVFSHIDEWAELTKRIGFFIDLTTPYTTMDPTTSNQYGGRLNGFGSEILSMKDIMSFPTVPLWYRS